MKYYECEKCDNLSAGWLKNCPDCGNGLTEIAEENFSAQMAEREESEDE